MPELGEVKRGLDIGRKSKTNNFIWATCTECGKQRWVLLKKSQTRDPKCQSCALRVIMEQRRGSSHPSWRGGTQKTKRGYILIWLSPDNFFHPMAQSNSYVLEHRLVMAQHLGRCLQPWEKVHHKDGVKDHNSISNLKMTTAGSHTIEHSKGYQDGYQKGLQDGKDKQIEELRKELRMLQWQLRQATERLKI